MLINKKILFYVLFSITPLIGSTQKLQLESNLSKSLSGFGDMWGTIVDFGVKCKIKKGLYLKTSFGIGKATSTTFSKTQLKEMTNLLVLDQWTENYPYLYIQESFEFGSKTISPATNFQVYDVIKIEMGYDLPISTNLSIGFGLGICRQKVENTYITAQVPATIISPFYEEIDGTITIPHVLTFVDYPLNFEINTNYKFNKNLSTGIFLNLNEGAIRILSAGIKLTALIVE